MPPRAPLLLPQRLVFRTNQLIPRKRIAPVQRRLATDDASKLSTQSNPGEKPAGANETRLPHVTEEQAELDKIMGEQPPEIEERGTPVQEVSFLLQENNCSSKTNGK